VPGVELKRWASESEADFVGRVEAQAMKHQAHARFVSVERGRGHA